MNSQSLLGYYYESMGLLYTVALLASASVGIAVTLYLLMRGRGMLAVVGMFLAATLPAIVGLIGTIDGMIGSFQVVAASASQPKPAELSEGIARALVTTQVGLVLAIPIVLLAIVGSVLRSQVSEPEHAKPL